MSPRWSSSSCGHCSWSRDRSIVNGDHCESSQRRYSVWGSFSWISSLMPVPGSSAAERLRALGRAGAAGPAPAAAVLDILMRCEDLPRGTVGITHPDLVLPRVAARRVHLLERGETSGDQSFLRRKHILCRADLEAGMVERAERPSTLALCQREVDRRLRDGELRVTRLGLLRMGSEESLVERDRALDVGDGERQVRPQDSHERRTSSAWGSSE